MELSLHLLGIAEIRQNRQAVAEPSSSKAKALLYYLAVTQRAHTRAHLASLLWGDVPDEAARANLRKALSELSEHFDSFICIERQAVSLRPDAAIWVDAVEFALLLEKANQQPQGSAAIEPIEQALALYQGDFLAGHYVRQAPEYEAWMLGERAKMRQAMVQGLDKVAAYFAIHGDLSQAIVYTRRLLEAEPWREETHRQLMTWLAQDDQRSAALAQYEICRNVLAQELDVAPNQATTQLYERLQQQDRAPAVLQHLATTEYPLVGRQHEWQTLQSVWQQALRCGPQVVAIVGEAGMGKTRLAEELLVRVQQQGYATLSARAYALNMSLAYAPVAAWLRAEAMQSRLAKLNPLRTRELARLLPELLEQNPELVPPSPLLDLWQRRHFFEALRHTFTADDRPTLLLLDDIHWCDQETIEWLAFMLAAADRAQILLVVTMRPEEINPEHPLHTLWRALLSEERLTTIPLSPLSAAGAVELAALVTRHRISEEAAAQLYQETAGIPLFVVERMHTGDAFTAASGARRSATNAVTLPGANNLGYALPPKVLAVLEERLAGLSPSAQALAQLLACIGRACRVDMLVEASQQGEDQVVAALDELWQRRLVQEVDISLYDFSHEYLRAVAYSTLSPVRRRLLHQQIAQALATLYVANLSPIMGELAYHYEQAGRLAQAASAYHQAATLAKRLYAHAQVVSYLERAVALLHLLSDAAAQALVEIDLWHELGVAHICGGGRGRAAVGTAWQRAQTLAREFGTPFQKCRSLLALDYHQRHRGQFQQAPTQSAAAFALAQEHALDDPFLYYNLLTSQGVALYHTGHPAAALAVLQEVLVRSDQMVTPTFDWLAMQPQLMAQLRAVHCLWLLGLASQARTLMQQAVEEEQRSADEAHTGFAPRLMLLDFSAMFHCQLRDVAGVQALAEQLLAQGNQHGFAYFPCAGRMYMGWALAQQGDTEVGLRLVRESLAGHHAYGFRMFEPFWRSLLADVLTLAGQHSDALHEVETALAYSAETNNFYWDAELLRQRGECLHALAAPAAEVVQSYEQALYVARTHEARALEVRAAVSLARFYQQQHDQEEARLVLAATMGHVHEGIDTPDVFAARTLLNAFTRHR